MKCGWKWMVLAVAALVSTSARAAVWDPNADPCLVFNMNFEAFNNGTHTTTDAKGGLVGTLEDYNTVYPNVFGETSAPGLGFDANFAAMHDNAPGDGVASNVPTPNDVRVTVPSGTYIFDLDTAIVNGSIPHKHTWTFWFNAPSITSGTIIRHAYHDLTDSDYTNYVWEIRIYGGVIQFYHKNNCLKMQTGDILSNLGVTVNTWHHVAVVIDRGNVIETSNPTTQLSSKIYVDGLEVPIIVTSVNTATMVVDQAHVSPLWIGAGEREFDGLLDDVHLYARDLNAVEVSILNQPDKTQPVALLPIPRSSNVIISSDVTWVPAGSSPAPTAQKVYFGTNTDANLLPLKKTTDGTTGIATNAELGGPFSYGTTYYWYIRSTISGVDSNGPLWSFTSDTGKAINPSPVDGAEDIDPCDVNLLWFTPTAATYTVYASATQSLVESNDVNVRIANGISDTCVMGYDPNLRGTTIYWRVNSTYAGGTIAGDIWSFRTKPYELVFNTDINPTTYEDYTIPALTCLTHGNGWSDPCATGTIASDGVAVFNFASDFNYDHHYDIIVVPQVRPEWVVDGNIPTPLAIHVAGNFYFDGRVQIAGDDVTTTTQNVTYARSGGFPGPKYNQDSSGSSVFASTSELKSGTQPPLSDYWTAYSMPSGYYGRFGTITSTKSIYVPTALAQSVFGPGVPVDPPYKGGGGGGAGGVGGDAGRGYFFGVFSGGPSYGDKEVPVPFGGSAGGWGGTSASGAAGGGGIEIIATGNVTLDVNSQINAGGGNQACLPIQYPNGGGGGGSVKIIAGGSVTNKGTIDVSGGGGGDGSAQTNNTGGGGGGGRVAIFYGTTYSNTGFINTAGGGKGVYAGIPDTSLAQDGQDGTIYVVNSSTVSPKKASAPRPANGNTMVYCNPDPCTNFQLQWYSGYNGTTDVVYCDPCSNPTTVRGSVSATRGQHSVTMTVSSGNTYYWKVVTDGSVSSDTWSFKTVNWRCRKYDGAVTAPIDPYHVGGPEWDFTNDCVLDISDFDYFAENWLNPIFGQYTLEFLDFARLASEWHQCFNRTDNGCAGY